VRVCRIVGRADSNCGFGAPEKTREWMNASARGRSCCSVGCVPGVSSRSLKRAPMTSPVRPLTETTTYGGYLLTFDL